MAYFFWADLSVQSSMPADAKYHILKSKLMEK